MHDNHFTCYGKCKNILGKALKEKMDILKTKGFTLVEIIIVIAVLSFGILTLTHIFPYIFQAKSKAEDYSLMGILAQNLAEEIRKEGYKNLDIKYPQVRSGYGRKEGKFKGYPQFRWQVEWWQTDVPNLRKIKIEVFKEVGKKNPQKMEIVTYIAKRE